MCFKILHYVIGKKEFLPRGMMLPLLLCKATSYSEGSLDVGCTLGLWATLENSEAPKKTLTVDETHLM